ncbi:hypothetical protein [Streptomyces sp. NPDC002666]
MVTSPDSASSARATSAADSGRPPPVSVEQALGRLAGTADLTGGGKAVLTARDNARTLWLYRGTGKAATPFAARTGIGGGWNTYNILS